MSGFFKHLFNFKKQGSNKENDEGPSEFDRSRSCRFDSRNPSLKDNQQYINETSAYNTGKKGSKYRPGPRSLPAGPNYYENPSKHKSRLDKSYESEYHNPKRSSRRNHYYKTIHETSEYGSGDPSHDSDYRRRSYNEDIEDSDIEEKNLPRAEKRIKDLEGVIFKYQNKYKEALEERRYMRNIYNELKSTSKRNEKQYLIKINELENNRKQMELKLQSLELKVAPQLGPFGATTTFNQFLMNQQQQPFFHKNVLPTTSTTGLNPFGFAGESLSHIPNPLPFHNNPLMPSLIQTLIEDDEKDESKNFRIDNDNYNEDNGSLDEDAISERQITHNASLLTLNDNPHLVPNHFIMHPPFPHISNDHRKIIIAANHRCNKNDHVPKNAVWSILLGHWKEPSIPAEAMAEVKEIETWILMLLSSPVPVPGKTKVELELVPKEVMPIIVFALPDHTRFSLVDFPLHLPLELLGVETTIKLLAALMLEYKVVLQSTNYNAVSMCVLSLVALMYPLEYMFPVIPLLPSYMPSAENILLAPTPFIIGLPASFFGFKRFEVPNDVIVVDLDTNVMNIPEDMDIPEFPEPEYTKLKQDFEIGLKKKSTFTGDIQPSKDFSQSTDQERLENDGDQIDIAIRVAMINFFNSPNIFANFSEHTRTLRLYPRPVVALQTESFLQSRPLKTPFIRDLCSTQSVEYFAECCLCPRNETYVRVQTGISQESQIGDKAKWFSESLMPVHFLAYPDGSTIIESLDAIRRGGNLFPPHESEADESSSEVEGANMLDELCADGIDGDFEAGFEIKPVGQVNHIFSPPLKLEVPNSASFQSFCSSMSSGRTTPDSSSDPALDSEPDFARMAKNMVLKRNEKGDFAFETSPLVLNEDVDPAQSIPSTPSKPKIIRRPQIRAVGMKGLQTITDSGEKMLGPNLMNTLNGFTERSSDMLSQMINKTAPKAQALKEKTMKPLHDVTGHHDKSEKDSNQAATQQSKSQQIVRETCDQILNGNGIGVFAYPKVKRLMEDESLRELVCGKLNLGLSIKYTEEEYEQKFKLTKAQYKGYVKIFQACINGLETSFFANGSNGLASMLHVLEIAHCAYWSDKEPVTPSSGVSSLVQTPSASSSYSFAEEHTTLVKLPATTYDVRHNKSAKYFSPQNSNLNLVSETKKENPAPPLTNKEGAPPIPPRPPTRPPPPKQDSLNKNKLARLSVSGSEEDGNNLNVEKNEEDGEKTPKVVDPKEPSGPVKFTLMAHQEKTEQRKLQLQKPSTLKVERRLSAVGDPTKESPSGCVKRFLYQDLIMSNNNPLWQNTTFWENGFFDVVAQERDKIGMDQEPSELIDRYSGLIDTEKKRLELDEDRILATLLHNMTAYMVMCGTNKRSLQQKIRRLLGKAHIGLIYSKKINQLLDQLPEQQNNCIALRPLVSRLMQKQSFAVNMGSDNEGQIMFMEVCDDAVVLRAVTGAILERWWYERLVNMTYSPKTHVLCIWRKKDDQVYMHKFYTKKCRNLYNCMKSAMERAAARGKVIVTGRDLEGEFPVHDVQANLGGLLQVRMDGLLLTFETWTHFIDLSSIKRCNTYGGNQFVIEEFNRDKKELVQRRFISNMTSEIVFSIHRLFSIYATLNDEHCVADILNHKTARVILANQYEKSIPSYLLGHHRDDVYVKDGKIIKDDELVKDHIIDVIQNSNDSNSIINNTVNNAINIDENVDGEGTEIV
uniref:MAP kinase-activating death domain protein n=1 Tax=Rhabditophanes sp. KR3021 TaxID=114890 RepID=A0AC35U4W9_9BILA